MLTITKKFTDIPFGHRQAKHDGHCRWGHGHDWAFELTFTAEKLDENGFVIDFGKMGFLKDYFLGTYDHSFLISKDDPARETFEQMDAADLIRLRVVEDCSCEGLAVKLFSECNRLTNSATQGRVMVTKVTVYEDSKNSATVSI